MAAQRKKMVGKFNIYITEVQTTDFWCFSLPLKFHFNPTHYLICYAECSVAHMYGNMPSL